jgi:hypothetical protein
MHSKTQEAISQLQVFAQQFLSNPAECKPPKIETSVLWELARMDNPNSLWDFYTLRGLAMLPYLPADLKEELFALYLSFEYDGHLNKHGQKDYRACENLAAGLAANPTLTLDQYFAIRISEDDVSHSFWNNPSTPPEITHRIFLYRMRDIDDQANPPSWVDPSHRIQGERRWKTEDSLMHSYSLRIRAAIKSPDVEVRFNAFLEAHRNL